MRRGPGAALIAVTAAIVLGGLAAGCTQPPPPGHIWLPEYEASAVDDGGITAAPQPTRTQGPCYPDEARRNLIQGTVVIELEVNTQGVPVTATVLSGNPMLTDCALDAALGWRFSPAMRGTRAIPCRITIPFQFSLQ